MAAWARRKELALPPFYVVADRGFLDGRAKKLGIHHSDRKRCARPGRCETFADALPVVDSGTKATAEPGKPDDSSAGAAIASIRHAVDDVRAGHAAAVVTNPIAKSVLYRVGFKHPGHTEYLAELAANGAQQPPRPVMMLWSPTLAVIPVTIHVALREAVAQLTTRDIVETCTIAVAELKRYFGIANPRIAVGELNPHAGEEATLGKEEGRNRRACGRAPEGVRHRCAWPAARGHDVPRGCAQDLRLRGLHVSRSGADPDQDAGVRGCGQRHAGPALHPHIARSRHRIRHRRHRPGEPLKLDRFTSPRRMDGGRRHDDVSTIDDLPPLREVIRRHELSARKSLGQNFLLDLNLTARIARAAGSLDTHTIVEIGPGPGGLTRALLALGARRVIAVERDDRAIAALQEVAARYPGRLDVVAADALEFDPRPMLGGDRAKIVANLPYNIATALLTGWLSAEPWPPWYDAMVLMFQREVAERIVANVDDDAYGRLAVFAGWRSEARIMFDVAPSAFVPHRR